MKNSLITLGFLFVISGCASNVKVEETPVEDKTGTMAQQTSSPNTAVTTIQAKPITGVDPGPIGVGKTIYFDYDSFIIKAESQSLLEAHARYLRADKSRRVSIEGHADERGGREYNLSLGQKRSEATRKALTLLGVQDSQLEAISYGKEKPIDFGHDELAWSKNRRAVVVYR